MVPKSPSDHATDLVLDRSTNVMEKLIGDLERMLASHAAFDRWLTEHELCLSSGKPRNQCHCSLCA